MIYVLAQLLLPIALAEPGTAPEPTFLGAREGDPELVRELLGEFERAAENYFSQFKKSLLQSDVSEGSARAKIAVEHLKYQEILDAERKRLLELSSAFPDQVSPKVSPELKEEIRHFVRAYRARIKPDTTHLRPETAFSRLRDYSSESLRIAAWEKDNLRSPSASLLALSPQSTHTDSPTVQAIFKNYKEGLRRHQDAELNDHTLEKATPSKLQEIFANRLRGHQIIEEELEKLRAAEKSVASIKTPQALEQYVRQQAAYVRNAALEYWHLEGKPEHAHRREFLKNQIQGRWRQVLLAHEVQEEARRASSSETLRKFNKDQFRLTGVGLCLSAAGWGALVNDAGIGATVLLTATGGAVFLAKVIRGENTRVKSEDCARRPLDLDQIRKTFDKELKLGQGCGIKEALDSLLPVPAAMGVPSCAAIQEGARIAQGHPSGKIRVGAVDQAPDPLAYIRDPADREMAQQAAFDLKAQEELEEALSAHPECRRMMP